MTQGRAATGDGPRDGGARQGPPADPPAARDPEPAGNGPIRRTVRIVNPRGLHPRIIDLFTRTAKRFNSAVVVWHGELRADGKSLWDLIGLVAEQGAEVVLEVDGPDAAVAVVPLAEILAAPSGEDYTI
jgi:phosphotransferase system HPr (HPr) family protein